MTFLEACSIAYVKELPRKPRTYLVYFNWNPPEDPQLDVEVEAEYYADWATSMDPADVDEIEIVSAKDTYNNPIDVELIRKAAEEAIAEERADRREYRDI